MGTDAFLVKLSATVAAKVGAVGMMEVLAEGQVDISHEEQIANII